MPLRKWSDNQLIQAVASNTTLVGVAQALGLKDPKHLVKHINRLGLSTEHMRRTTHKQPGELTLPLDQVLVKGRPCKTCHLKLRLFQDGVLEQKCSECGVGSVWHEKPLVLQMHHLDGDRTNNLLENLQILCPNCHTQTPNYGGKKNGPVFVNHCLCGEPISPRSARCLSCEAERKGWVTAQTKIHWPSAVTLKRNIQQTTLAAVARKLGVSPTAVRKHLCPH